MKKTTLIHNVENLNEIILSNSLYFANDTMYHYNAKENEKYKCSVLLKFEEEFVGVSTIDHKNQIMIFVKEKFRGKGYAKLLINSLIKENNISNDTIFGVRTLNNIPDFWEKNNIVCMSDFGISKSDYKDLVLNKMTFEQLREKIILEKFKKLKLKKIV